MNDDDPNDEENSIAARVFRYAEEEAGPDFAGVWMSEADVPTVSVVAHLEGHRARLTELVGGGTTS